MLNPKAIECLQCPVSAALGNELSEAKAQIEDLERRLVILQAGVYRLIIKDYPNMVHLGVEHWAEAFKGMDVSALWTKHEGCWRHLRERPPEGKTGGDAK